MAKHKSKKQRKQKISEASSDRSNNYSQFSSDLLKQYGLDEHINPEFSDEPIIPTEKIKEKKPVIQDESIPSHADTIGWNNWKTLLINFLYGLFMGCSDAVPGYSGGTTLTILGFYEKLVHNFKLIFKPDVKKYFWKYVIWFIPFLIAWVGALLAIMQLVNLAAENNRGVVLAFLFGSFAFFSIPLFLVTNKSKMVNYKDFIIATKAKEKWTLVHWIMIAVGLVIMVGVAIAARLIPQTILDDGTIITGVTFVENSETWVNPAQGFDAMQILFLLVTGFFAGFCMLIPGISGSLVLFMTGWYPKISQALSNALTQPEYLPWIVILLLGIVVGIISSSFAINAILKKWEKIFYSLSLGLISGSFIAIFVSLSNYEYAQLTDPITLGLSIMMIFVAVLINVIIFIFMNETKKINYPRFRIFNKTKASVA